MHGDRLGLRTSPQLAALANGVASHALDFDFTFQQGQLMAPVIPALLPLAEQNRRDAVGAAGGLHRRLRGLRAAVARQSDAQRRRPLARHLTIGAISAAVACARLMKAPAAAMPDVIGIAVSMASGVNANYGTMTKPLHAGHAARNGIMAAHARQVGLHREPCGAGRPRRLLRGFARGMDWSAEPFDDLGTRYDLVELGFRPKRYPCGGVIHTGIDAALQIRDELGPKVADIAAIKAGISKYAASRAGSQYPANMEAAKFNLQYVVAAALAHGVPKLATFEPDAIEDPRVKELAGMVKVAIDPEFADVQRRRLSDAARGDAQGRPHRRAPGDRCQRHGEEPDVARADAREVLRLRGACRRRAVGNAEKIAAMLDRLGEQTRSRSCWPLLRRA